MVVGSQVAEFLRVDDGVGIRLTERRRPQDGPAVVAANNDKPLISSWPCSRGLIVDNEVLAHIWPSHHKNVHFHSTHSVDIDGEFDELDTDGYRPLRMAETRPATD
ncbi:hypothetical protein Q0Z83_111760 [Actinoplanes sichuanensis]|nr:hypothetical protein Q0Z83_111760 [Actinoplanes sichuanensis]